MQHTSLAMRLDRLHLESRSHAPAAPSGEYLYLLGVISCSFDGDGSGVWEDAPAPYSDFTSSLSFTLTFVSTCIPLSALSSF